MMNDQKKEEKVLVTGATGFLGRAVSQVAAERGWTLKCALRHELPKSSDIHPVFESCHVVGEINGQTDWRSSLEGVSTVIHLAAKVHDMSASSEASVQEYREVNTQGSINLARQAAACGVKRLIFMSSIKVNGEGGDIAYKPSDKPRPEGVYARSKYEAEEALKEVAAQTGLELVIIRPPLVYGAGVKGNFPRMVGWVKKGFPLPLASVRNKRSFIALDNLVDFILLCVTHPKAASGTFLVSDGEDVSTPELLRLIARVTASRAVLFPVPVWLMLSLSRLLGQESAVRRLSESLLVDVSDAKLLLGWAPPLSLEEGLQKALR